MPKPPNIDIQGLLVRRQRNHLRLTQEELARRVYLLQDKSHIPDRDTLERRCRDWEVSSKISRQTLSALATALGVSPAYLLGEAPDPSRERTSQIADRLRDQVVVGAAPAIEFIAAVRELSEMGAIPPLEDDAAAYWQAARALECRLGAAQLTSDRAELATVANILDWNTADLRMPAAVHPYWLMQINCTYGERLHLVRGTESAVDLLSDAITTWCQDFSGEGRAILVEDGPWFRIHLEEGSDAQFDRAISLVRCEPGDEGLNYTKQADQQRTQVVEAVLPSLQPYFQQIGQLKFASPWVLTEQAVWPVGIRDFIGPIQPLWVRGAN
jgi:transcriptional regulator with XRE-family HTH domain